MQTQRTEKHQALHSNSASILRQDVWHELQVHSIAYLFLEENVMYSFLFQLAISSQVNTIIISLKRLLKCHISSIF